MKSKFAPLAGLAALGIAAAPLAAAGTAYASTDGGTSYQATLQALNHASGSGTLTLTLNGNQVTISEQVTGLASTFSGAPYPHVQHIHIGAMGTCPTPAADKNGDGVISTTEGAPSYGGIGTTLSTKGSTSPNAGTNITIAPAGGSFNYSRTVTLSADAVKSVTAGTGVIVVHGLDPATLSTKAQNEKSDLVPSLPLAATSPALCGPLVASQMGSMPSGAAQTGDGGSISGTNEGLVALGGVALAGAGAIAVARRRSATKA